MRKKSKLSIHAAVMNCLARCCDSEAPLLCLADFTETLRSLGWSEEDTQQVQEGVLQLLSNLNKDREAAKRAVVN